MNILALDTSGATASAAVSRDGYVIGEMSIRNGKTHSQKVIPMIESLLSVVDLKPTDIELVAVANGPGSFTGLRIGVVTMKAFAYALNIPLVEVSTLMSLAYTLSDGVICPIMDARNRQVFTAVYRLDNGHLTTLHEDCGISVEALTAILKGLNTTIRFVGDAVPLYKDFFKEEGIDGIFTSDALFTHRASTTASLAWTLQDRGMVSNAYTATPNYLRKSQAERMKRKKSGSTEHE